MEKLVVTRLGHRQGVRATDWQCLSYMRATPMSHRPVASSRMVDGRHCQVDRTEALDAEESRPASPSRFAPSGKLFWAGSRFAMKRGLQSFANCPVPLVTRWPLRSFWFVACPIDSRGRPQTRRLPLLRRHRIHYVPATNARGASCSLAARGPARRPRLARLGRDPSGDGGGDSPRSHVRPSPSGRSESRWPGPSHTVRTPVGVLERPSAHRRIGWTAELASIAGRAEGCPLRVGLPTSPFLQFCATFDVGSITGQGKDLRLRAPSHGLWLAPGSLAARFLGRRQDSWDRAEGGVSFPLRHYQFFLPPDTVVYSVPAVAAGGSFGVTWRFL